MNNEYEQDYLLKYDVPFFCENEDNPDYCEYLEERLEKAEKLLEKYIDYDRVLDYFKEYEDV